MEITTPIGNKKMKDFIEATDIDMWDIVENGYELPKTLVDRIVQPKVKSLWTKEERKKHLLTSKVKWCHMPNLRT